jgi:hypothetical protein
MPTLGDKKYFPVHKINYKPAPFVTGPSVKWPIVEVSFGGSTMGFTALIDSGASSSLLNAEIANVFGLKIDNGITLRGAGVSGHFKYWITKDVEVTILGHNLVFDFMIPTEDSTLAWPCILGHDSIFQVAKLEFTSFKEQFKIFFRKARVKKF